MSISLKPHNVETYQKVTDRFKESNKVAVIHPTGTGKMYLALKLLEENKEKKLIYIAPSNPILHDVKKNIFAEGMTMSDFPELKRITYQKLSRLTDEEIQELDADIIVLDEFHHCGAPEWGRGVERLLQKNSEAKVLGLSATPLRYNDGLRNMSDELFENNIASEMTLEEAIESGILPQATYVSTLYGYDQQLANMQEDIDKMQDENKKRTAQELLNNLKVKLDENTQNLPELFSEYMQQNKSGKYLIFCRNIEDMNEKIEQAQKMFGGVNPNINIRAVSSKIKESDRVLTEFEQDNEEGTLKLLYAVDMLNEGYHIKDLDGVVMMRPTFSPTIYTQQLGRALTVGKDRKPIVLDLVNNFDSCKIIEDFAEKMKKYQENGETEKTSGDRKSGLSIFDKTKEFREIAEKITELSKVNIVKLEQKIEIFEEFLKTGEELTVKTTFKGYPIGQWATQIRSACKRINEGKERQSAFNPTEEQLEKLKNMGILERKIDSTLDEKIDSLIEWRSRYPKATIIPIISSEILRYYAYSKKEYRKLQQEYEKMQSYYDYVRVRKGQGKLNEEQILKCKDGNVGGVFGYSTKIEELAKKYNVEPKNIDYILSKYYTLDEFYEIYKQRNEPYGEKLEGKDKEVADAVFKNVFEINGITDKKYENLVKQIIGGYEGELTVYSLEKLKDEINKLDPRQKYVLECEFGLIEGKMPMKLAEIANEMNFSSTRVAQIRNRAKLLLGNKARKYVFDFSLRFDESYKIDFMLDDPYEKERRKSQIISEVDKIKKDIQFQNGDLSENLNKIRALQNKAKTGDDVTLSEEIQQNAIEEIDSDETRIDELGLSARACKCLRWAHINKIEDISNMTRKEMLNLRNFGKKCFDEITAKMEQYGVSFKGEEKINEDENEKIEVLGLSQRAYSGLKRNGINSLEELSNKTEEQVMEINQIGPGLFSEIKTKMKEYGISFRDEKAESEVKEALKHEPGDEKADSEKEEIVKQILEKQKIIAKQQAEIEELRKILENNKQK